MGFVNGDVPITEQGPGGLASWTMGCGPGGLASCGTMYHKKCRILGHGVCCVLDHGTIHMFGPWGVGVSVVYLAVLHHVMEIEGLGHVSNHDPEGRTLPTDDSVLLVHTQLMTLYCWSIQVIREHYLRDDIWCVVSPVPCCPNGHACCGIHLDGELACFVESEPSCGIVLIQPTDGSPACCFLFPHSLPSVPPQRSGSPLDEDCDVTAHKLGVTAKHYLLIDTNVALHQVQGEGEGSSGVSLGILKLLCLPW